MAIIKILTFIASLAASFLIIVPLTGILVRFRANYNPKGLRLDSEGVVHVEHIEEKSDVAKGINTTVDTPLLRENTESLTDCTIANGVDSIGGNDNLVNHFAQQFCLNDKGGSGYDDSKDVVQHSNDSKSGAKTLPAE